MEELIKTTLELFIEKAEELTQEEFTKFIEKLGHQLSYLYTAEPQQLIVTTVAPTETMNKSFLLTYRMFVQEKDKIGFINPNQKISRQLLDSSLSPQWLEQVKDVAQKIHTFLREKPTIPMNFNLNDQQGNTRTENPTRWDILETLLYGEYAHSTKRKRLNNWLSTPFAPMIKGFLMMEFRDILAYTLGGILHLAHYARIELTLPQVSGQPRPVTYRAF